MKLSATEQGALVIDEMPVFFFQLLGEAPAQAASDDPVVENRFYPAPATDEALVEDWKSLVQPELQEQFRSAREVVLADLRSAEEKEGHYRLSIPAQHMDAWLNALNQARLAIAEENGFGEEDLASSPLPDPTVPRSLALFQLSFYGFLQECLVQMQE